MDILHLVIILPAMIFRTAPLSLTFKHAKNELLTKFSTLDSAVLVYAMQFVHITKQLNIKLKTQLKQFLGSLLLAFVLTE